MVFAASAADIDYLPQYCPVKIVLTDDRRGAFFDKKEVKVCKLHEVLLTL